MHARRRGVLYFGAACLFLLAMCGTPPDAQPGGKGAAAGSIADYDELVRQLEKKVPQKKIIEALQESPTHFTLSDDQIKSLKAKGASAALLDELQKLSVRAVPSDVRNIGIVLDCSGSMLDKLPDGSTKIDVAKKVVTDFIRRIRNGRNLTLIVYGIEPKKKCQDVHLALPLTEVTDAVKDSLAKYIANIQALGQTPLAEAMKLAGRELEKGKGLCMLVVVTDGMESCKGDPGAVADAVDQKLEMGGVDLIGLGVSDEETKALKALARKSLRYIPVAKGTELDSTIRDVERTIDEGTRKKNAVLATKIAEIVKDKGGKTGQLEIALAWFNKNDLDLHVTPPSGPKEKIYWDHRKSKDGGQLDVDMNVVYDKASKDPVEHVVWDKKAPVGQYKVLVHHYKNHDKPGCKDPSRFVVQVKYKGKLVDSFSGQLSNPEHRSMLVTEFTIEKSGELVFPSTPAMIPKK